MENNPSNVPELNKSVSTRILGSFIDTLAEIEGFQDVAMRLKETVIEKNEISEKTLREALFGKAP